MSRDFNFFMDLRRLRPGEAQVVTDAELADIAPAYWKGEPVKSQAEWFVEAGRGVGLKVEPRTGYFIVTLP